jgi:hypothetical protein
MGNKKRHDWPSLVAEFRASGLSQAAFCIQKGLCPKHFSLAKRRIEQALTAKQSAQTTQAQHLTPSPSAFVQLQPPHQQAAAVDETQRFATGAVKVYVGQAVLEWPCTLGWSSLAQLLKALA